MASLARVLKCLPCGCFTLISIYEIPKGKRLHLILPPWASCVWPWGSSDSPSHFQLPFLQNKGSHRPVLVEKRCIIDSANPPWQYLQSLQGQATNLLSLLLTSKLASAPGSLRSAFPNTAAQLKENDPEYSCIIQLLLKALLKCLPPSPLRRKEKKKSFPLHTATQELPRQ